jgi:hypothetical protein
MICTLHRMSRVIKSRRMRWAGYVARVVERVHTGLWWGNLSRKRPLVRARRRWEDNFKLDRKEVGLEGMDRIYLIQD